MLLDDIETKSEEKIEGLNEIKMGYFILGRRSSEMEGNI
jgi:hypothetical protein